MKQYRFKPAKNSIRRLLEADLYSSWFVLHLWCNEASSPLAQVGEDDKTDNDLNPITEQPQCIHHV